uniref:Uncharacterized protein n=1 Tax=Rhizophora mucronata TaxID=61149 RepID=A0A2P2PHH6_RHIMU
MLLEYECKMLVGFGEKSSNTVGITRVLFFGVYLSISFFLLPLRSNFIGR